MRSTTKYWVKTEDVSRVKYHVLQHLPVFLQPAALWYPSQKGYCNKTDGGHGARASAASLAAEADCVEGILRAVAAANPQRPLFVPAYGVDNYVDVAAAMQARLAADGWEVVGAQDFARLGRQAAPGRRGR